MRCLLAVVLALVTAASALSPSFALGASATEGRQEPAKSDRRIVTVREFVIKVESRENAAYRALWVSRDGGATWKPAGQLGVTESWGEWAKGVIRCSVRVPEDGAYDFFAQLGDAVSNRGPEPEAGKPADARLRLEVREPARVAHLQWSEPRGAAEWTGGSSVTLAWHAMDPDFRSGSAELQYAIEGEPWISITRGLEPTGQYAWVVPNKATKELRLRVRALTRAGLESAAESEAINVRVVHRANVVQARALYDRARVLHAQQRVTEARLKYQEALQAWPDYTEVYNDLGKLHAEQREPAKALEYFLRARKTCPSDPVPAVNAARMEAQMGLVDDAMADLREAVALGLEGDERASVLAGETLWVIARDASLAKDEKRMRDASELLLKIRQAAPATRAKAKQLLEWASK